MMALALRCCRKCAAPAHGTPHFLYLHIEKTGGSAIECAWQRSADEGLVSLLGAHLQPR